MAFYNWLTNGMMTIKKNVSQRCVTQKFVYVLTIYFQYYYVIETIDQLLIQVNVLTE